MKIRTRSRLILVGTLVIFLIVLSFITQSVIIQSFRAIEVQESTAHVQRFIAQINNEIEDVAARCRDWSVREEMSRLVTGTPEDDLSHLFPPAVMRNLGIDYIAVYDETGRLVCSASITTDNTIRDTTRSDLDRIIRDSIVIEGVGGVDGRRGVSLAGADPVILAGYTIPAPGDPDSPAGTLVMARLLDRSRIGDMSQMLQIDGEMLPYSSSNSHKFLSPDDEARAMSGGIVVLPESHDALKGYAMVTGIENDPTHILLRVSMNRPVMQQIDTSMQIVASGIICLSIVFILLVQLLMQRFILAPLSDLDAGIRTIGESVDLSLRMPEQGDEEILSLTRSLNRMLDKIEIQRSELHALLEEIEQQRDDLSDARQALAERNRELEELNRKANLYLDIYLDAITYEILNATMGLRGYAQLFRDSVDENGRSFADKVIRLAEKSGDVIRNIETISRIYKNPPELRPVDLASIIKREMVSRPGAAIVMDHCNRMVLANDMLGVVFDNIFSNSMKFGGDGTTIFVSARDLPGGMVEISVTDTGPGIPDQVKPYVFDRFMEDTRKRGSYGLGLHIVKMLIESYGGSVVAGDRIVGDPQSGAAIRFTLRPA